MSEENLTETTDSTLKVIHTEITDPTPYDVVIIGAGFCGTLALVKLIKQFDRYCSPRRPGSEKPVNILWVDIPRSQDETEPANLRKTFCGGSPYQVASGKLEAAFRLTQPARLMSPFVPLSGERRSYSLPCPDKDGRNGNLEDTEHFARWYRRERESKRTPDDKSEPVGLESYATRSEYRQYLQALADEYIRGSETVEVVMRKEKVTSVSDDPSGYRLVSDGKIRPVSDDGKEAALEIVTTKYCAKVVIGAFGHLPMPDRKRSFGDKKTFIKSPDDPAFYEPAVDFLKGRKTNTAEAVAIIGGSGNSAVDAILALCHQGFNGRFVVITNSVIRWWPFDPYVKNCEGDGYVPGPATMPLNDELSKYIQSQSVRPLGRHSLAYPLRTIWNNLIGSGLSPEEAVKQIESVKKDRGTTKCPDVYRELIALYEAGRLEFRQGTVSFDPPPAKGEAGHGYIDYREADKHPWRWMPTGGKHLSGDIFVDATGFMRGGELSASIGQNESPLGLKSGKDGLYEVKREGKGFFLVGPFARPILPVGSVSSTVPESYFNWGVETFRVEVIATAQRAFAAWLAQQKH